jgi:LuxR family quorum-sensing system transcriptional regulator CciR
VAQIAKVQDFVDKSRLLSAPQQLHELLQETNRALGFDYFALVHNVEFPVPGTDLDELNREELVVLSDYPDDWIDAYIKRNLGAEDPVLVAARQARVGFCWAEIPNMIDLTSRQHQQIVHAREVGVADGFTVPAKAPGASNGSCHFVVRSGNPLPTHSLLLAELVGIHAFHAARLIVERIHDRHHRRPKLSPRQRDCIELVGRGKTDWEIAQILGIQPATVKEYLDDARRKYGVSKRVQVVLRAVFDGELFLGDLLL